MQIRRVLLLFALVLGLSAVVASIAPPPEDDEETASPVRTVEDDAATPPLRKAVRLRVRRPAAKPATRRVEARSSFSLEVTVPEPGDVVLEGLGLRQTADPLTPARFDLLASPRGRYDVDFAPVDGDRRVIGRLAFVRAPAVKPRRRDR